MNCLNFFLGETCEFTYLCQGQSFPHHSFYQILLALGTTFCATFCATFCTTYCATLCATLHLSFFSGSSQNIILYHNGIQMLIISMTFLSRHRVVLEPLSGFPQTWSLRIRGYDTVLQIAHPLLQWSYGYFVKLINTDYDIFGKYL